MDGLRPQPRLLLCWRIRLALLLFPLVFCNALLFPVGYGIWLWGTLGLLVLFFAAYFFYLPVRYRRLVCTMTEDRITLCSGVFVPKTRSLLLCNVQFSTVMCTPLEQMLGIASLAVTAAGGRLVLPGLRKAEAQTISALLSDTESAGEKEDDGWNPTAHTH